MTVHTARQKILPQACSLRGQAAFTLIEVIVVIGVISILAGSMAPMISQRLDAAREEASRTEMENLRKALLAYARDTGGFPAEKKTDPESLALLEAPEKAAPPGWRGPYIIGSYENQDYTRDAWNKAYRYRLLSSSKGGGDQVMISSAGPDRGFGGKDDLSLTILIPMEDVSARIERTSARLKLLEGDLYALGSDTAPQAYKLPKAWQKDAWGNAIRYKRYNAYSAAIYSPGPNGVDDGLDKDDLYRALVWVPKQQAASGGGGKVSTAKEGKEKQTKKSKKSCGKKKKKC